MARAPGLELAKESNDIDGYARPDRWHGMLGSVNDEVTARAGLPIRISGSLLGSDYFADESAALAKLESVAWPQGPICVHCGHRGSVYHLSKTRIGLKKCRSCGRQFTVRVGTAVEASHLPLHKWLQAIYLLRAGPKSITAQQLRRTLEITYKSAWLTVRRIRKAESADLR